MAASASVPPQRIQTAQSQPMHASLLMGQSRDMFSGLPEWRCTFSDMIRRHSFRKSSSSSSVANSRSTVPEFSKRMMAQGAVPCLEFERTKAMLTIFDQESINVVPLLFVYSMQLFILQVSVFRYYLGGNELHGGHNLLIMIYACVRCLSSGHLEQGIEGHLIFYKNARQKVGCSMGWNKNFYLHWDFPGYFFKKDPSAPIQKDIEA